jgi:hypothetical protein
LLLCLLRDFALDMVVVGLGVLGFFVYKRVPLMLLECLLADKVAIARKTREVHFDCSVLFV